MPSTEYPYSFSIKSNEEDTYCMSNFFVSIPDDETNVSISFADDCEPLATNSSIRSKPVSAGEPHSLH